MFEQQTAFYAHIWVTMRRRIAEIKGCQMKRKLWAAGQAQASSLPTRLHIPLQWGFPTACHLGDSFCSKNGWRNGLSVTGFSPIGGQCRHLAAARSLAAQIGAAWCNWCDLQVMMRRGFFFKKKCANKERKKKTKFAGFKLTVKAQIAWISFYWMWTDLFKIFNASMK